ncbi:MAG: methyltransferase, TIGR04325 family [Candidatus Omnitrophota bacterium]|nr:methyltransferase, TIGR04325 family [Candidatus Omnitrophota bacterium]
MRIKDNLKNLLLEILPPFALKLTYLFGLKSYIWCGNFNNWQDAKSKSAGYDDSVILEKVKNAALRVKNGEAVYERDSVILEKIEYSWPLVAALMFASANKGGKLDIVDYGGSLGSVYFQVRKFLVNLRIKWGIVEQENFVECGRKNFEDERLKFYYSLDECLKHQDADLALLSGVLQCVERPYELLEELMDKNFNYLVFDRTTFNKIDKDRLSVLKVSPKIYPASYPWWFLNEPKFKKILSRKYILTESFFSFENRDGLTPVFKGFIYKLKSK